MVGAIAVEVGTVCSIVVGLLSLDDVPQEFTLHVLAAEEVADCREVRELDV